MSKLQRDVSNMLYDMGIDHVCEYDEEEFALDIVLSPLQLRVCIEVDGPVHYTTNTLRPVGATLLKRRLLRCLGWQVRLSSCTPVRVRARDTQCWEQRVYLEHRDVITDD